MSDLTDEPSVFGGFRGPGYGPSFSCRYAQITDWTLEFLGLSSRRFRTKETLAHGSNPGAESFLISVCSTAAGCG